MKLCPFTLCEQQITHFAAFVLNSCISEFLVSFDDYFENTETRSESEVLHERLHVVCLADVVTAREASHGNALFGEPMHLAEERAQTDLTTKKPHLNKTNIISICDTTINFS